MLTRLIRGSASALFVLIATVACTSGVAGEPTSLSSAASPELAAECEPLPEYWEPEHEELLVLDNTTVRAGDIARFRWAIDPQVEIASGDVITFQCWTGSVFSALWSVLGVYREPSVHIYALDGGVESNAITWPDRSGRIIIPDMIPNGTYVLRASVQIVDRDAPTPPPFNLVELAVTVGSG